MNGLILRLAGPLQSWGEHSTFSVRDTTAFPTRSGILGILAAAQGRPRGHALDDYEPLEITVRVDRPGRALTDFHTVGGGLPRTATIRTAAGTRRAEGTTTLVSHRHYLTDAIFTVGIQAHDQPSTLLLDKLADALTNAVWAPYLGRRSCVPDQPLLLRTGIDNIDDELRTRTPLARTTRSQTPPNIEMLYERAPEATDERASTYELLDIPETFASIDRRYRLRRVYRRTQEITSPQYTPGEPSGLDTLLAYAQEGVR